jgi:hypothetical protein
LDTLTPFYTSRPVSFEKYISTDAFDGFYYIKKGGLLQYGRLQIPGPGEGLEAAVVGLFRRRRETATRQLPHFEVILQTIAANTLVGTRVVGAIAPAHIFLFFAVHNKIPICQTFISNPIIQNAIRQFPCR